MIKLLLHTVLVTLSDVTEEDEQYRRAKALGIELALDKRESAAVEYGIVNSVGPTAFKDYGRGPDIIKEGDKVSFAKYSGKSVTDTDGKKYVIINDSDVLCVIE